jgi:hypothetical protein
MQEFSIGTSGNIITAPSNYSLMQALRVRALYKPTK